MVATIYGHDLAYDDYCHTTSVILSVTQVFILASSSKQLCYMRTVSALLEHNGTGQSLNSRPSLVAYSLVSRHILQRPLFRR